MAPVEVEAAPKLHRRSEACNRLRAACEVGDDEETRLWTQEAFERDPVSGDPDAGIRATEGQNMGARRRRREPCDGCRTRSRELDQAVGDGELSVRLEI